MKIRAFIFAALLCMSTGFTAYASNDCVDTCVHGCDEVGGSNCKSNCASSCNK